MEGMIMKNGKRVLTILLLTAFALMSMSAAASAASKKYALPSSAKVYVYSNGKVDDTIKLIIKYNKKGDPVRYGDSKISYKYKGKKRQKVTIYTPDEDYGGKIVLSYKNGKLYKTSEDGKISLNKKGWVKRSRYGKSKITVKYYKNGSPKLIKCDGEVVKFNKKGLPVRSKTVYSSSWIRHKYFYSYDKKGRVKTIAIKEKVDDDPWAKEAKVKFSYAKKRTTTNQRKWAVIISNAAGGVYNLGPYYFASLPYAVQNDLL